MKQPYEDLPKVWAWNDDKSGGNFAYHVKTNKNKHHMIIMDGIIGWAENIEPYKEPPKRPMTHVEVFKLMQENLSKGLMTYFKIEGDNTSYWDTNLSIAESTYSTDLENWKPLEVEE